LRHGKKKVYNHCYRLSSSLHRLINFLKKRRKRQRWQSDGWSVVPAITGQAGEKTLYMYFGKGVTVQSAPGSQDVRVGVQGIYW
jgi:hypothetical protein